MLTKIEEVLESVNGFGKYQKIRYMLICISGLLPPIASYMHSFIAASPKYACSNKNINFTSTKYSSIRLNYYYSNEYIDRCNHLLVIDADNTHGSIQHTTTDSYFDTITNAYFKFTYDNGSNFFEQFNNESIFVNQNLTIANKYVQSNLSNLSMLNENQLSSYDQCPSWSYDKTYYEKTLTEEWNLVCGRAIWRSNMQAIYYTGILVGSILQAYLSKQFGQKPTLAFSLFITIIGSLMLSFGPQAYFGDAISYILLVIGRFLIAIGSHGVSINGYFLAMETIGRSKKKYCSLIFEFMFSLGQLVLVLAAYFLRDWRHLTFTILLPCLPFLFFVCLSKESLQYLISKKKFDKMQKVLESIAKTNKIRIDETLWKSFLVLKDKEPVERKTSTTIKSPKIFFIIIIVLNWIINNFIFHGLGLRSNDLGANPYLTFALSAFAELLACLFTFKLLEYNARRKPYFILILIAGFCCTTIYFSKNLIVTVICALVAKFSVASSYAVIRVYTSELFSTSYKKNYLTSCSIMARLGSIIAPFIIGLGDYHFKQLPFLIFGISCFVSGLLTFALPKIKEENTSTEIKHLDKSQQIIQNNWLDGEDICLDEDDEEDDIINQAIDEIEMR